MPDFVQNITIGISLFESLERLKDGNLTMLTNVFKKSLAQLTSKFIFEQQIKLSLFVKTQLFSSSFCLIRLKYITGL